MSMSMHVCICMQSVAACIACIRPLGHGNHHQIPKTPSRDPASGGFGGNSLRSPQDIWSSTLPLYTPIPVPPLDPIFLFFLEKSVFGPVLSRTHGHRIGQDPLDRPNHDPVALPWASYRTQLRVLKSIFLFTTWGCNKDGLLQQFCVLVRLARP